jgi:hypothetical protein
VAGKAGEGRSVADRHARLDDPEHYPSGLGAFMRAEQELKPGLADAIDIRRIDEDLLA